MRRSIFEVGISTFEVQIFLLSLSLGLLITNHWLLITRIYFRPLIFPAMTLAVVGVNSGDFVGLENLRYKKMNYELCPRLNFGAEKLHELC